MSTRIGITAHATIHGVSGGLIVTVPTNARLTVADWLPVERPKVGDNFCGIDRSVDPERLAGWRGILGGNMRDTVDEIGSLIYRGGGRGIDRLLIPVPLWYRATEELAKTPVPMPWGPVKLERASVSHIYALAWDTWVACEGGVACRWPGANGVIEVRGGPTLGRCTCDMSTLLRSGCRCGGV